MLLFKVSLDLPKAKAFGNAIAFSRNSPKNELNAICI